MRSKIKKKIIIRFMCEETFKTKSHETKEDQKMLNIAK